MFTQGISFKNFLIKKKKLILKKNFDLILKEKNQVISSLSKSYKDSFSKKIQNILIKILTIELLEWEDLPLELKQSMIF